MCVCEIVKVIQITTDESWQNDKTTFFFLLWFQSAVAAAAATNVETL